jgi:Succinylglutamate desuccinylase / Aspartoacylase family
MADLMRSSTMLDVLDRLPSGFDRATARDLDRTLAAPTLIHLPGRRPEPLFVSVLLHGNEDTGLKAIQSVLARHGNDLPRALSLFVGNVSAAKAGVRRLDAQPDYNRVWPGSASAGTPEHAMMAEVVAQLARRRVFASIDIHNNTGLNPNYSCVNALDDGFLHLATLFSRTVVFFRRPLGVQSAALARYCPAITIECGKPGNVANEVHAAGLVEAALALDHFPERPVPARDLDLYHTVAVVKIPREVTFSFDGRDAGIKFSSTLEQMNFRDLALGTVLGEVSRSVSRPLEVWGEDDSDLTAEFLRRDDTLVRLQRTVTPSMLTLDQRAVRQDCLCYFMERLDPSARR